MYWDYILSISGVLGFILAGKKIWWAWYINLGSQFIWFAYSITTQQYGFLIGSSIYFIVFASNAISWTKEHFNKNNVKTAEASTNDPSATV